MRVDSNACYLALCTAQHLHGNINYDILQKGRSLHGREAPKFCNQWASLLFFNSKSPIYWKARERDQNVFESFKGFFFLVFKVLTYRKVNEVRLTLFFIYENHVILI